MSESLKKRCLALLREKRLEDGACYHGFERLAKELQCDPLELFDWENDQGILYDLRDDGDVILMGGREACAMATMDDPWR